MSINATAEPSGPTVWCACPCLDCSHSDHCEDDHKLCFWHKDPKFFVPPVEQPAITMLAPR